MTAHNPATPVQTREMFDAEQARINRQVRIRTDDIAYQTVANDRITTVARQRVETGIARNTDYDRVTVNGMEMKREQYLRLVEDKVIPAGAVIDDPYARKMAAQAQADGSFGSVVPEHAEGNDENDGNKAEDKGPSADDPVFASGQRALDAARAELGADTVEALVGEAVHSGDLEAVKTALVDGNVSAEQIAKVYSAYVASAQSIMADSGVSVETMSELLSEDDLRAAREGVVKGDISRVQTLAGKTIDTLATLPESDPAAFEAYVDRRFPDLAYRSENGKTLVATSEGWMPWDSLVRSGLLRNAKPYHNPDTWAGYEE